MRGNIGQPRRRPIAFKKIKLKPPTIAIKRNRNQIGNVSQVGRNQTDLTGDKKGRIIQYLRLPIDPLNTT